MNHLVLKSPHISQFNHRVSFKHDVIVNLRWVEAINNLNKVTHFQQPSSDTPTHSISLLVVYEEYIQLKSLPYVTTNGDYKDNNYNDKSKNYSMSLIGY